MAKVVSRKTVMYYIVHKYLSQESPNAQEAESCDAARSATRIRSQSGARQSDRGLLAGRLLGDVRRRSEHCHEHEPAQLVRRVWRQTRPISDDPVALRYARTQGHGESLVRSWTVTRRSDASL